MDHDLHTDLVRLSHDERLSPEFREACRAELGDVQIAAARCGFDESLRRVWQDIVHRHLQAAQRENEDERKRLFDLVGQLDATYPQTAEWSKSVG